MKFADFAVKRLYSFGKQTWANTFASFTIFENKTVLIWLMADIINC